MLIDVAISGDRNVIEVDAEKILKYIDLTIYRPYNISPAHVECKNTSNRGNRNHLEITQKTSEQHIGKA
jgi:hypothetical protein